MPNFELHGMRLECLEPFEAAFLARDIGAYFEGPHAAKIARGDVVLDVGANIGLFTAELSHRLNGEVKVLAFEPLPPIYAVLQKNASGIIRGDIQAFPFGLSGKEATLQFSFFPLMSFLSSSYRDETNVESETARAAAALGQMIRGGEFMPWMAKLPRTFLDAFLEGYLKMRMKSEKHTVRVRPLSAVIEEQKIGKIDLLKIDVEGAEEEVLNGIEDRHWPQIRQIVLELENYASRAKEVSQRLEGRGLRAQPKQSESQKAGNCGLIFAARG